MDALSTLIKTTLLPGSAEFLVVGVLVGVLLLYAPGLWRWGRRWLVLLLALYLVIATPACASRLERGLTPAPRPLDAAVDALGARVVVVLGNGIVTHTDGTSIVPVLGRRTAFNVMEGARLYRLLGQPQVILSGGIVDREVQAESEAEAMAAALERLGVPRAQMVLESKSTNTYEQSEQVRALVGSGTRLVLVTTATHMPRALGLFKARGLQPVPSPSRADDVEWRGAAWTRYLPNGNSLRASELAIYEYLAVLNGWERGWLRLTDVPR